MAPLTILSDANVRSLLMSLDRDDILELQQSLADALHHYSTTGADDEEDDGGDGGGGGGGGGPDNGCGAAYQPLRTSLRRAGRTTLFMPATSNDALGVKIVTLAEPAATATPPTSDQESADTDTSSSATTTSPRGTLTLLSADGTPRALVNAEELTAFRTALTSTMLFAKRASVHTVTVFGAGAQAFWHVRLALLLRPGETHHLNVVNRTFDRAASMLAALFKPALQPPGAAGPLHHPRVEVLTPRSREYARLLREFVRGADALFATTPATEPLFPPGHLTHAEGRRKGRYIAAVGSYRPHMCELHPDVLRAAVGREVPTSSSSSASSVSSASTASSSSSSSSSLSSHFSAHLHLHHRHPPAAAVVVDSVASCLHEAGEVIQAGLTGRELVELGELVMLKRDAEARRRAAAAPPAAADRPGGGAAGPCGVEVDRRGKGGKAAADEADGLREWLARGNVVFKCVGLGLMDVVVGGELVRIADERGVGTRVADF